MRSGKAIWQKLPRRFGPWPFEAAASRESRRTTMLDESNLEGAALEWFGDLSNAVDTVRISRLVALSPNRPQLARVGHGLGGNTLRRWRRQHAERLKQVALHRGIDKQ